MTDRPDICSQDPARAMADLERWLEQEVRPRVAGSEPAHAAPSDAECFDRAWSAPPSTEHPAPSTTDRYTNTPSSTSKEEL